MAAGIEPDAELVAEQDQVRALQAESRGRVALVAAVGGERPHEQLTLEGLD